MAGLLRACARIARLDAPILPMGENGTGKERLARHIHDTSARAKQHFVRVHCGAGSEALLESELFGHAHGPLTGLAPRKSRVAMAEGGTLFLDEIGELPLALQVKFLGVLQEHTDQPAGSAQNVTAPLRLIAATNRNLAAEVEAGRLRRDLYDHLQACPLELPPLRNRTGDVMRLFNYFWANLGERRLLEPAAERCIELHPWAGNVRELENLAQRLSACTEGAVIHVND